MSPKFTHYLVTRFNVPIDPWKQDKEGKPTLDQMWLQHRLDLFTKYCVPTVSCQTEKNFTWIVYCDSLTMESERKLIESAIKNVTLANIRYAESFEQMMNDLRHVLADAKTPYVISSRLDNDDGIGNNFIKTIQENFKEKDKLLLNFTRGIFYDERFMVITKMKSSYNNHYTSLIEKNTKDQKMLTVLGFSHSNPPEEINIENIHSNPSWLKIIHERNVKSQLKGKPILNLKLNNFSCLNADNLRISYWNTMKYVYMQVIDKIIR